ncbi:hypothetical protein GOC40_12230 [Sinorhizobium meliloti]|nr:hypothetical protein [Sinorhizobium meliloti]
MKPTFEELLRFGATDVNGIMVSPSSISSILAKYATNLAVFNEHPTYPLSLCGSATPIHFEGRFFLACCSHQLRGRNYEHVGLLTDDGSYLVTSAGVRHFIRETDSDYSDLVVFDFTDPCIEHADLRKRFFDFREIPPDAPNTDTLFLQVTGFPTSTQGYDVNEEARHLALRRHKVICELDSNSSDDALLKLKTAGALSFDPDGMSGGSAFTVQWVHGRAKAYLAGMTVRAGRDHIHILKSGYIRSFLRSIVDDCTVIR